MNLKADKSKMFVNNYLQAGIENGSIWFLKNVNG